MPRKPAQPLTEEEKFKQQLQQEQELQCLQRQYNLLEKDRLQYGLQMGRFNKILAIYKKEHANISTDLGVASSSTKKRQCRKDMESLTRRIHRYDYFEDEVKRDRQGIKEIDFQIRKVEKDVFKLRSMQVTDRHREERVWQAMKTVEGLMNKLDVQNGKFGMLCAINRRMKAEIRRMLWERDVFMKIWNKLINQLVLGKKFMTDLTEQATIAYDEREQWVSRLQALRIKAHHDFMQHSQEMRELKRKQDSDRKLTEFFSVKGQKRVMKALHQKEEVKRIEHKQKLKERLTEYKKYLNDIWEFTQQKKVYLIAKDFYEREATNFGLFMKVNEMIVEMETMNDHLADLQLHVTEQHNRRCMVKEQQDERLKKMEANLAKVNRHVEEARQENEAVDGYIKAMLSGIFEIFNICKCNQDPVLQLLGDNTGINVYNYPFFVEMIEKTIQQAVMEVFNHERTAIERKKMTSDHRVLYDSELSREMKSFDAFHITNPCPLCIEHELVTDVIDSVQSAKSRREAGEALEERKKFPDYFDHLHNVSNCFLPESRELIQKRYLL